MNLFDCIRSVLAGGKKGWRVEVSVPIGDPGPISRPPIPHESRDLIHCHTRLQEVYPLIQADFKRETGNDLFPTHTYRSPAVQFELFKKGRRCSVAVADSEHDIAFWVPIDPDNFAGIVTNCDGYKFKSRHNIYPARAIDSAVDTDPGPGKAVDWDEKLYLPLGPICQKYGLVWAPRLGPNKRDLPHIELPMEVA